jgi:hypothetical protein
MNSCHLLKELFAEEEASQELERGKLIEEKTFICSGAL